MIKKLYNHCHIYGIKPTFQKIIQKIIGVEDVKENINVLYYYLNLYHSTTSAPTAKDPELRILQLCDAQLLRIVAKKCEILGLNYWLDFGTLLGAVRHKGFIPWDDDMDISMPRNDYNRALSELKDELTPLGITFCETDKIGVGYRHEETGIWLDILAKDDFNCDNNDDSILVSLDKKINRCKKSFSGKRKYTIEEKELIRMRYIGGDTGKNRYLYLMPEFNCAKNIIHPSEMVFPLKSIYFEGYSFNSPSNYDPYLKCIYGTNYMQFPQKDILHHDLGRGPLSTWAKKSGVNMNEVLCELSSIANSL
jgi:lipopolysaccharide cholinephosphotransferase